MSDADSTRYDRQTRLPMIGARGQKGLEDSQVAILGCGALGTVVADILARAGVGRMRLIDRDVVEWTNLQRQSLYTEDDARLGKAKAEAARDSLLRINSRVQCEPLVVDLTVDNIDQALDGVDLVIDAADNFSIRFLLNDYSLEKKLAWVHGGCVGTSGQVAFFTGQGHPCFRCLVPEIPPASIVATCDTAGVLGSATHAIASLQATEAIKWLTGNPQAIRSGVWSLDFWNNRSRVIALPAGLGEKCKACGSGEREYLFGTLGTDMAALICGRQAVQLSPRPQVSVDLPMIADRWKNHGAVSLNRFFVKVQLPGSHCLTLFRDGRVVVDGTDDIARARSLYCQLVGG